MAPRGGRLGLLRSLMATFVAPIWDPLRISKQFRRGILGSSPVQKCSLKFVGQNQETGSGLFCSPTLFRPLAPKTDRAQDSYNDS